MLRICMKMLILVLCIGIFACEPESLHEFSIEEATLDPQSTANKKIKEKITASLQTSPTENLRDQILNAVAPSECGATEFSEVIWKHFTALASDDLAVENMDYYLYLQENAVRLKIGTDYFGQNGEYTKHVEKTIRSLERFWEMPGEIQVLGQHTETLNDREKIADILWYSVQDLDSREDAYYMADEVLNTNRLSRVLPDSPFFAADGFARPDNRIVIGDGLIQMFSETGLEEKIVWTGILTHEWAHQIQFDHFANWYPAESFQDPAERTRTMELEADFFSGYFMTHKRGATFNWKRAEEFFELFYQAGDCSFEFEQHHGTPLQRKRASYEGHLLAEITQKKGKILSAEQLHEYFRLNVLPRVLQSSEDLQATLTFSNNLRFGSSEIYYR